MEGPERSLTAAHFRFLAETRQFIVQQSKYTLPCQYQSFALYQFTCSCIARYSGHTTKRLFREHVPAVLRKDTVRNINRAVPWHFTDNSHVVEPIIASKLATATPIFHSKELHRRLLMASKIMVIRLIKPKLCKHCNLVQMPLLPWLQHII